MAQTNGAHPGVQRVLDVLTAAGLSAAAGQLRMLGAEVRTAVQAAAALGIEVGAIGNSLVFDADSGPLLALTSGAHRADTTVLAELVGATSVGKAGPDFVRTHTGQPIGGVAPVGHPNPIRTLVDTTLRRYPAIWVAGGHPKAVFPIAFDDLVTLTGGTVARFEVGCRDAEGSSR